MTDQSPSPTTPQVALDLSRNHAVHRLGDITVHMTWTHHDRKPCIVLIPAATPLHFDRVTPCIVPMDAAWLWDEHTGDGAHAASVSFMFCNALGFTPSPQRLMRITSIIRDLLGDLVLMPPMPAHEQTAVGTMIVTDRMSGKTLEKELTEDV